MISLDGGQQRLLLLVVLTLAMTQLQAGPKLPNEAADQQPLIAAVAEPHGVAETHSPHSSATIKFDQGFLQGTPYGAVNLSQFEKDAPIIAGQYSLELYVNEQYRNNLWLIFNQSAPEQPVRLCLTPALIKLLGLEAGYEQRALEQLGEQTCGELARVIPGVRYAFDQRQMKINFLVPQIMLAKEPRGYVAPELWSKGNYAAAISYDSNTYWSKSDGADSQTSHFINLRSSVHLKNWALRHDGNWHKSDNQSARYQRNNTYLQTDVPQLMADFKLGEFYSGSEFFDGVKIRGAEIASDEKMLPQSVRQYAPLVRGIASSNAKVTITQNDRLVYETTVAEGAFEIKDVYPMGSGDFLVTVEEANGRKSSFTVPYTYTANMIRPNTWRYGAAIGKVQLDRQNHSSSGGTIWQGYLKYGLSNDITLNAAGLTYPDYRSAMLGMAFNTRIGAFSADNYQSWSKIQAAKRTRGSRWRLGYSKLIQESATYLSANYNRYSEQGVHQLSSFLAYQDRAYEDNWAQNRYYDKPKENYSVSVNQTLPERWGRVYLTASNYNYWNLAGQEQRWQLGYSNYIGWLSYDISYGHLKNSNADTEEQLMVTFNLPLGRTSNHSLHATANHSNRYSDTQQIGISGSVNNNKMNYGVYANANGGSNSYSGNVSYNATAARLRASTSQMSGSEQYSVGMSGALVAYPKGIIASQNVGDSFAIIEAKDARGAEIINYPGTYINRYGQGVVPYVTPYEINNIRLSPKGMNMDVELKQTQRRLVARANTASVVTFETEIANKVLLTLQQKNGQPVPMGAEIFNPTGVSSSFVASAGRVFLEVNGDAEQQFSARWQGASDCLFVVDPSTLQDTGFYKTQTLQCQ